MKDLRILHISTAKSWRGGEQQLAYLLEELQTECQNFVFCSEGSEMQAHCEKKAYPHLAAKKRFSVDPAFAMAIKKYCDEQNIQLIHTHDSHAHSLAIIAATLFGNTVPIVVSRRVDFPIQKSLFSQYKYNHSLVKKILCVSKEIMRITALGIKELDKLQTVYSGVDLNKFSADSGKLRRELDIPKETFLIGNTSAIADHKDYFTFIDTAEKSLKEDPSLLFLIIGKGPMENEIASYLRLKSLGDSVRMIGFRNDIPEILAELDLFMITSKTEGLGTSIIDAFAAGVPVLATEAGGIPELVENEKTGLLCDVGDSNSLSESLARLKNDAQLRQKLIAEAAEKVKKFSKAQTAQDTLAVYRELLS
ncbi:MAG: glycosyl transferase [Flavobacteriales bacterium]|nr:glycosyl transferase [Flavobacteriales bacterium]